MDPEEKFGRELLRRLDILISLLLETPKADKPTTMTDKIAKLSDLGLTPAETGRILGKPVNYVTGALSARKRRPGSSRNG